MTLTIDPEFAQLIPAPSAEERAQLEASLLEEGCRDALVTWNGVLLDGHNRYAICQKHNIQFSVVERDFESREDALVWICTNQMARRNLTGQARAELVLHMEAAIAIRLKANQAHGQTAPGKTLRQNSDEAFESQRTDEALADMAGMSRDTIRKAKNIKENAPNEVRQRALIGDLSINRADQLTECFNHLPAEHRDDAARLCGDDVAKAETLARLYKSSGSPETNGTYDEIMATGGFHFGDDMEHWCNFLQRSAREIDIALRSVAEHHRREAIEARRQHRVESIEAVSAQMGCYPLILADPPWRYEHVLTENRAIENHYPTMTLDDICAMRVAEIAHEDAVLFLWATSPKLAEAMRVIEAWGFTYRTCMVWVKDKIGMGRYARQQHELLLIAARGALPVPEPGDRFPSVIYADRTEHSAKPDESYAIIERMYPEYSNRIELFSRTPREGWAGWGNQYAGA